MKILSIKRDFLLFIAACITLMAEAQSLTVGTYNIRYNSKKDAAQGDGWAARRDILCNQIYWIGFDIFGAQEVTKPQLDDMIARLPDYDWIGVGRDDGKEKGEFSPIFYKRERFKLLDKGTFWISETPDSIGVKGWDAVLPRVCTYIRLQDRQSKVKFWYFCLHMDHIGVEARREGAKLIIEKVEQMCGKERAIVVGDFNVDQHNEAYRTMLSGGVLYDCFEVAERRFANIGTWNAWKTNDYNDRRIDHIFVTEGIDVKNYAIPTDSYWSEENGDSATGDPAYKRRCISDHYPVAARIELKK